MNDNILVTSFMTAEIVGKDVNNPNYLQLLMASANAVNVDFDSFKGLVLIQALCIECDMRIHKPTFDFSKRTIYFYHQDIGPTKEWEEYTKEEMEKHVMGEQYIALEMIKLGGV